MKKLIVWLLISMLLISCTPKEFTPFKPEPLQFDKTPEYNVQPQLDAIRKPSQLETIYVKIQNNEITELPSSQGATHILLLPKEYAKIGALLKLAKTYKSVIIEQEELVNTYISQINSLKELVALERQKTIMYRELWVDSENRYQQEVHNHHFDNVVHKAGLVLVTIGSFICLAIVL